MLLLSIYHPARSLDTLSRSSPDTREQAREGFTTERASDLDLGGERGGDKGQRLCGCIAWLVFREPYVQWGTWAAVARSQKAPNDS